MLSADFWQDKNNSQRVIKEKKFYEDLTNSLNNNVEKLKDLDDLRYEFVKDKYGSYKKVWGVKDFVWDKKGYQKWIDDYVTEFIIENDPKPGSKLMATYDKDGDRTIVTITSEAKSKPVRKKKKED